MVTGSDATGTITCATASGGGNIVGSSGGGHTVLMSGTWLGDSGATQGNSANPRYTSIEITPDIRNACNVDAGPNVCILVIASINKYGVPRMFNHTIITRNKDGKEYVFIEETTYDNSLMIGDGTVQFMNNGAWVSGCLWRNQNDGGDNQNFTICERAAKSDGTWYDPAADDTSLYLTIDRQDMVSSVYYLYK